MTDNTPSEAAKAMAHRIVCEFRPDGWTSKEIEIAHLIDRHLPAAEPGWRDIATAPKDGSYILLLFAGPFHDSESPGAAVGRAIARGWWTTAIWAASIPDSTPIAWAPLPAAIPTPPDKVNSDAGLVERVAKIIHDAVENDDDSGGGAYLRAARAALSAIPTPAVNAELVEALRGALGHFALFNDEDDQTKWPRWVKRAESALSRAKGDGA